MGLHAISQSELVRGLLHFFAKRARYRPFAKQSDPHSGFCGIYFLATRGLHTATEASPGPLRSPSHIRGTTDGEDGKAARSRYYSPPVEAYTVEDRAPAREYLRQGSATTTRHQSSRRTPCTPVQSLPLPKALRELEIGLPISLLPSTPI